MTLQPNSKESIFLNLDCYLDVFCRIVFANSLGNFSDCVCELYSNPELSKDMPKAAFAGHFSTAYEVLFSGWLHSKSLKVS